ncbi:hypothetical protein C8R44DRAFT_736844 [Mycena epipterygia]|nr:hypothetical protein C8R44DRAFT_736844 [Mycena epipterygia]
MDIDPENQRSVLNGQYLATLPIEFLKQIIKEHYEVKRIKAIWKIHNEISAACHFITQNAVTINWVMVKRPEGGPLHEDYQFDTKPCEQRVDALFRNAVQAREIEVPSMAQPLTHNLKRASVPKSPTPINSSNNADTNKIPGDVELPLNTQDVQTPLDPKSSTPTKDLVNIQTFKGSSDIEPIEGLKTPPPHPKSPTPGTYNWDLDDILNNTQTDTEGEQLFDFKPHLSSKSPTANDLDDINIKPFYKIFTMVSDERRGPGAAPRATILYVQDVKQEANRVVVQTHELIQELQRSTEAVVGSARLSIAFTVNAMVLRTSFYILRAGAEYLGLPDIPHLLLTPADPQTMCQYTVHIFLDSPELPGESGSAVKRHFASLSLDDEEEKDEKAKGKRTGGSHRPTPNPKPVPAQRDPIQVLWLTKHYTNVISEALKVQVNRQAPSTCSLSVFCAYIYILSHLTPGDDCDPAGRFPITNKVLEKFLGVKAGWIGHAKKAGGLQISGSHLPAIQAHMNGDITEYLGIKPWVEFLEKAIATDNVKIEEAIE